MDIQVLGYDPTLKSWAGWDVWMIGGSRVGGWVTPRLDKAEQRSDWSRRPLLEKLGCVKAVDWGGIFPHGSITFSFSRWMFEP